MGRNEKRGNSLPALWYLEQTLKLRATKLSKDDARILANSKLEQLIPVLRYSLAVYLLFNALLLVEDRVGDRSLGRTLVRFFIAAIFLVLTFACTFFGIRKKRSFFLITYLCLLVQTAYTADYLYYFVGKNENSSVSPFLPLNTFFIYLFVRMNLKATLICSGLALIINEVVVSVVTNPTTLELGNIVLYLICNVLGFISGYIFELNLRSKFFLSREIEKDRGAMQSEREKAEKLLYNILPRTVADSLKNDFPLLEDKDRERERESDIIADSFDDTTIAFCDICDFTVISSEMNPEKLVSFLNDIFSSFDNLVHEFSLEKIKTIGDAYMFAGGLSKSPFIQTKYGSFTPAEAVAEMALLMQEQVDVVSKKLGYDIKVRVGINSGNVVAGIVGISKFVYDLFGETVNLASKMESSGKPTRVHVSEATYLKLEDKYDFEPAQDVEVKEKSVKTYFLLGRKGRPQGPSVRPVFSNDTLTNNLRLLLTAGETSEVFALPPSTPAKPSSKNNTMNRPPSANSPPIRTTAFTETHSGAAAPPINTPHRVDQVEVINPNAESPSQYGNVVIYAGRNKVPDPDSFEPGPVTLSGSTKMGLHDADSDNGGDGESPPPRQMPILAKSSSNNSVNHSQHMPLSNHRGVSFGSSATGGSRLEDGVFDPSLVPTLRKRDVFFFPERDMEVKYRKDYFRKYFRLVQLNALGGMSIYVTLGAMISVTLTSVDYGVLLAFGAVVLAVAALVFIYFVGNEGRTYMHYIPAIQSFVTSLGILVLTIVTLGRDKTYSHHHLAWDACIIIVLFIFVFPGLPFIHALISASPIVIAIIVSVIVVNRSIAFPVIIRLLMVVFIAVMIGVRKEQESRAAYYVTQTLDDERRNLVAERAKSEKLLFSILPVRIATKLKMNEGSIADTFYDVTVMFVSIHNFTSLTTSLNPFEKVSMLNKIFSKFDKLATDHKLEKIKTIGPTYLVVGGLPTPKVNHLASIANMALDMVTVIGQFKTPNGEPYKLKAGIHCGKVVAGVIGIYKFSYDLWGDTVNTASRMESHSLPGQIQVTETCYKKLASRFEFTDRGFIQVKGKGMMHTYFLSGSNEPRVTPNGRLPNSLPGNFVD